MAAAWALPSPYHLGGLGFRVFGLGLRAEGSGLRAEGFHIGGYLIGVLTRRGSDHLRVDIFEVPVYRKSQLIAVRWDWLRARLPES